MLKAGVVGGGHILDHRHLPVLKKLNNVDVVAVCDIQPSIAAQISKKFGISKSYTSFSELMKEDLDFVDICTPPMTHLPLAEEAMKAGCNVLMEKPLAMSADEVDQMYSLSKKENVKLCVVHQNLFNPAYKKAKRLVDSGVVGDIIHVEVGTYNRKDNDVVKNGKHWAHKLPGGIAFELLPHPIYLLQAFLKNSKPSYVLAKKTGDLPWMKTDDVRVLIDADNASGLVVCCTNSPFHGDTLNILGTKMGLIVDLWGRSILKYKPRTQNPVSVGKANISLAGQCFSILGTTLSNFLTMGLGGVKVSAHYGFIRSFVDSIEKGDRLPVSEKEAKENVAIVESICRQIDESVGAA
jgi:predicted dehydrogenase